MKRNRPLVQFNKVEDYINPSNTNIFWYYIPGYNGYEISNTGILRSMKHYKKYPYGLLVKPKEVKDIREIFVNNIDFTYEISNNNNERVVVNRSTLWNLSQTNPYGVSGYPRYTYITDMAPRNQRIFVTKNKPDNNKLKEIYQYNFVRQE